MLPGAGQAFGPITENLYFIGSRKGGGEAVRHNRLALLQHIAALADCLADLSYLEGF